MPGLDNFFVVIQRAKVVDARSLALLKTKLWFGLFFKKLSDCGYAHGIQKSSGSINVSEEESPVGLAK